MSRRMVSNSPRKRPLQRRHGRRDRADIRSEPPKLRGGPGTLERPLDQLRESRPLLGQRDSTFIGSAAPLQTLDAAALFDQSKHLFRLASLDLEAGSLIADQAVECWMRAFALDAGLELAPGATPVGSNSNSEPHVLGDQSPATAPCRPLDSVE